MSGGTVHALLVGKTAGGADQVIQVDADGKVITSLSSLQGLDHKDNVATSTEGVGNITLSGEQTLNGVLTSASRIFVIEQTSGAENGIYVTAAGAWARSTDADEDVEVTNGMTAYVDNTSSTVYRSQYLLITPDPIVVDTTVLTFVSIPNIEDEGLNITVDGQGFVITTGVKGDFVVPWNGTITSVIMLADVSGSIVVDIFKDTFANFPPVVGDSITAAAKPTITTATKSEDTTLTGWTTALTKGDILRFNVDSATDITRVALQLQVTTS